MTPTSALKKRLFGLVVLGTFAGGAVPTAFAQDDEFAPPPSLDEDVEPTAPPTDDESLVPPTGDQMESRGRNLETPGAQSRTYADDLVVVPRRDFLKAGRLELMPTIGASINDPLIRHYGVGGNLTYFLSEVFSVGIQGMLYVEERSAREGLVGLQFNATSTLNQNLWCGAKLWLHPGLRKVCIFQQRHRSLGPVPLRWRRVDPYRNHPSVQQERIVPARRPHPQLRRGFPLLPCRLAVPQF